MTVSKKIVYVLEDDPDISELVRYILDEAGYEVVECRNVRDFNELTNTKKPDIFVLDILLPDGNGLEVCKLLQANKETAAIPVLMMSANQTKREVEAFGCAADFISKPFNIDNFREKVDQFA